MKDKKYFCYEIFKNLSITSRNGRLIYSPCCSYHGFYSESDNINVQSAWSFSDRKKIIELVSMDQPVAGCKPCYDAEASGLVSRRQSCRELYEDWHNDQRIDLQGPQALDYFVGNLCNLKCVICNPGSSSQWIPDYQKLYPEKNIDFLKYQKNNQLEITDDKALSNIISLHFHGGGEPLLSDVHINLLERVKQVKGLGDVRVSYNTNGTVRVPDSVLKLWEECKLVEIYFSIDDIESRFNYQRTNANWTDVQRNLQWYYTNMPHNHMFKVNCTWSYLNFYYLDELCYWHSNEFAQNRYGDPTNLIFQVAYSTYQIKHISQEIYNILQKKFNSYPNLMLILNSLIINDQSHRDFWQNISALDRVRNTQYQLYHQEWAELIK